VRRALASLAIAAALALTLAPAGAAGSGAGRVDAADYDAFWLWGGVAPPPVLARARSLYLLRGQVSAGSTGGRAVRLIAQGGSTPHLGPRADRTEVWIVYRAQTLDWPADIYTRVLDDLARWRAAGNRVAGIQIDFDAHTRHLDRYAAFLKDLRSRLAATDRLSITGLLDWSSQGDPAALDSLAGVVDEVVLQTYQGRRTVPDYDAYLARLGRMTSPFKIGLVEGGAWAAPAGLAGDPWFRGYVVFLTNRGRSPTPP
jgi:hypothetical protein